jgi:hypothetical protein
MCGHFIHLCKGGVDMKQHEGGEYVETWAVDAKAK